MPRLDLRRAALLSAAAVALSAASSAAAGPASERLEFFESRIRPVLVEQCYECHNSAKAPDGGLTLDDRAGLLKGGDGGAVIVPGKPAESRLLPILRHEVEGMAMPRGGAKLEPKVVADFEKWIADGALDPRDKPPSADEIAKATSWEAVRAKRMKWWSFQPVPKELPAPPAVRNGGWSEHPVDRFVLAKLEEKGLEPAPPADARALVRRLYFSLVGLPPSFQEVEHWAGKLEASPAGYEELVDHLLASPHFGVRWARHWMDWVRYAESHGSEGDPAIHEAWRYRDYLVRALNADVPFDQLVREHVAGDLLEKPRLNPELGINESVVGTAHWRMVFHGFTPTDALDERVRFTDDQINAFSKAFLGLTVSCARCHNHKFDAISQADYYALYGVLSSARPSRHVIDLPEKQNRNRDALVALKPAIRASLADAWTAAAGRIDVAALDAKSAAKEAEASSSILHPWRLLRKEAAPRPAPAGDAKGKAEKDEADPEKSAAKRFAAVWAGRVRQWKEGREAWSDHEKRSYIQRLDFTSRKDYGRWFKEGAGLPASPQSAGEFALAPGGDSVVQGIYPAGVYTHLVSAKHAGRISSDKFNLGEGEELWVRTLGDGATARYVVQDYPRDGTVYTKLVLQPEWGWRKLDLSYWSGDEVHLEITNGLDAPLLVVDKPRSWFGVREAVVAEKGAPSPPAVDSADPLDSVFAAAEKAPPESFSQLAGLFRSEVAAAVSAWKEGKASDSQALLLDQCVKLGLLPNRLADLPEGARDSVAQYRKLEEEIPVPVRTPGIEETVGRDQRLMERGDHKRLGEPVPRRFLEAVDATPYKTSQSGRRELAEDLLRADNPFTRRVIVNRLWTHLFGQGLVASPDNFGRLGSLPTHPELLDHLAVKFAHDRWSLKSMIRHLATSKTWRLASTPSAAAAQLDPANELLSHAHVRRLEAEAVRDSLLVAAGKLDPMLGGPPADAGAGRRSLYLPVKRNNLDPFLRVFDFPEPFTAVGRRDATNVPAQALTLMNDPRVASIAAEWADRLLRDTSLVDDGARYERLFLSALGRTPRPEERKMLAEYLEEAKRLHVERSEAAADLRKNIHEERSSLLKVLDPVRRRLTASAAAPMQVEGEREELPKPVARWDFVTGLKDLAGGADASAREGAERTGGGLRLDGKRGHAVSAPLAVDLKEKTLEAWVQLGDREQRGGGVVSIQSPRGEVFDALVFAEKDAGQWLAGSNHFLRTQSFRGPQEEASDRPVHLALTYHADGRVVLYRNGEVYGEAYRSDGPAEFKAGQTVVSFGVRHLPAGGNRMFAGTILKAAVYAHALTHAEVKASGRTVLQPPSEAEVLAALSDAERGEAAARKAAIEKLERELADLGPIPETLSPRLLWSDLARAVFSFKEFIYLR